MLHDRIKQLEIPEEIDREFPASFDLEDLTRDKIKARLYQIHMTHFKNGKKIYDLGEKISEFRSGLVSSNYHYINEGSKCILPELIDGINKQINVYTESVSVCLGALDEVQRIVDATEDRKPESFDEKITSLLTDKLDLLRKVKLQIEQDSTSGSTGLLNQINQHLSNDELISLYHAHINHYKTVLDNMCQSANNRLKVMLASSETPLNTIETIISKINLANTKVLNVVYGRVDHTHHDLSKAYKLYPRMIEKISNDRKNLQSFLSMLALLFFSSLSIAGMACFAYYGTPTLPTEYLVLGFTFSILGLLGVLGSYFYKTRCSQYSYDSNYQQGASSRELNSRLRDQIRIQKHGECCHTGEGLGVKASNV